MTLHKEQTKSARVAFLLDNLNGGGAERVVLNMALGFSSLGYEVDLLVCELRGELCDSIPSDINLVVLDPVNKLPGFMTAVRRAGWRGLGAVLYWVATARKLPRTFRYIDAIIAYLRERQPEVIFSALRKSSVCAVLAASESQIKTRVFVGVQNSLSSRSEQSRKSGKGQVYSMVPMFRYCFSRAEGVIAASRGVAQDAIDFLGLPPERVHVAYNPVFGPPAGADVGGAILHPWFRTGEPPVIIGIGRLVEQKNFPMLLRAFAAARQHTPARLVILGGDETSSDQMANKRRLQALAVELGIADDFLLTGFQRNPHHYLAASSLFVMSSRYEGFGNVLVEALLAGCPIVSTDCPSGPAEILDGGKYGTLVPVDDVERMSEAMLFTLRSEPDRERLRRRGSEFSLQQALDVYHTLFFGTAASVQEPGASAAPATSAQGDAESTPGERLAISRRG